MKRRQESGGWLELAKAYARKLAALCRSELERAGLLGGSREETRERRSGVYPDDLMSDISRSTLRQTVVISLVIHVVVIFIASVPYFARCIRYGSLDPDRVRLELKQKAEEEAREARLAERQAAARPAAAAGTTNAAAEEAPGDGKSPIEREIEEVSDERPAEAKVSLDDLDTLE